MGKAARIKRERKEDQDRRHTVVSKKKKPAQSGLRNDCTYSLAHLPGHRNAPSERGETSLENRTSETL